MKQLSLAKSNKYVMGVDAGGYDEKTFIICVYKKDFGFVYMNQFRKEDDFNKEVERLAAYYNIPDDLILKESK